MSKPKRVLIIDPTARTVTESTVKDLADMQAIVGGSIELVHVLDDGHEIYANEEALLGDIPNDWFKPTGAPQPYAGRAYIIGSVTESGNNRACSLPIDYVERLMSWMDISDVRRKYL